MKSAKIEMNKGLLEAWLEAVHENGLPVNIHDESDKMLVMGALNATINEWAGLV